jgi:hypothetical protein
MEFWQFVGIAAVSIVIGMIVALRISSGRPINFNVDSHAEAHGGSATSHPAHSSASSSGSPSMSGGLGILKWIAAAALAVFAMIMMAGLLGKINATPERVVVNVPTAPPPVVITVIPPTAIPNPVVAPIPVAIPVPIHDDTPVLVALIPTLIIVIIGAIYTFRRIVAKPPAVVVDNPLARPALNPGQPIQYRRTSYGWTPVTSSPEDELKEGDVLVENFFSKVKRS